MLSDRRRTARRRQAATVSSLPGYIVAQLATSAAVVRPTWADPARSLTAERGPLRNRSTLQDFFYLAVTARHTWQPYLRAAAALTSAVSLTGRAASHRPLAVLTISSWI